MSGETDLDRLLAGLEPRLDETQYAFETAEYDRLSEDDFALVREAEGITVVRPGSGWARITLGVHSSLDAVGLTARISEALAAHGIPANMIAGLRHDHVFVPWAARHRAMAALRSLSQPGEAFRARTGKAQSGAS